jgi:Cu/Zn superoxide dismutase
MAGNTSSLLFILVGFLALIQACTSSELQVASFVRYPGSSTNSVISGVVYVTPIVLDGILQHKITWKLTGTDDACATGDGNVCGIHIHEGSDCSDASTIGGHLHSSASRDPWTTVRYDSSSGASTSATGFLVATGLSTSELTGRALVVHNSVGAGERIACGVTEVVPIAVPLVVKTWSKYPGSTWSDTVSGIVTLIDEAAVIDTVALSWELQGVDDACPIGSGNVCGIHIHTGTSCDTAEEVGGHFYNTDEVSEDPWTAVRYSSANGVTTSSDTTEVAIGFDRSSIIGRAVVVHNSVGAGERIACGIIQEETHSCQGIFDQCGGMGWLGQTCCVSGTTCTKQNDYYAQCLPSTPDNCVTHFGKCGGKGWTGATTCCIGSQECVFMNSYYSGCRDIVTSGNTNGDIHV